jgi:signal transduction histidine kinase/ligand-binding sensor domain-containing protein
MAGPPYQRERLKIYYFARFLSVLALCCAKLAAIDPHQPISQMHHTSWTGKEGVLGAVLALAQTTDGFLWLGTTAGLMRFDGSVLERYKPEVGALPKENWISALLASPDGSLWIGYLTGGVSLLTGGKITNYPVKDGVPGGRVRSFAQDGSGNVWVATVGGLGYFDGTHWQSAAGRLSGQGPRPSSPASVMLDKQGNLWVSDPKQGVTLLPTGGSQFQQFMPRPVPGYFPTFVRVGNEIWLWVPESRSLLRFPATALSANPETNRSLQEVSNSAGMFLIDRDGSGWMMTAHAGIWRVPVANQLGNQVSPGDPSIEKFTTDQGLTNASIQCVLEDREGNIWVGTSTGLDRFRARNASWSELQPVATRRMQLVSGEGGEVWASSPQGLWDVRSGRKVKNSPANINFSFRDPDGSIWLWSEHEGTGDLWRWKAGQFRKAASPSRNNSNPAADKWVPAKGPLRALTRDGAGDLWVSIRGGGVWRQHGKVWSRIEILKDAAEMTAYGAICDGQSRVWLAYPERRAIGLWDHGNIQVFSPNKGLDVGAVTQLAYIDGNVWAGGESGLAFFGDGRFHNVEPIRGTQFGLVAGIAGASKIGLCLSTPDDIIYIPQLEINKVLKDWHYKVQYERFDPISDLSESPSATSDTPAVMGTDGILWVATSKGVIRLDPTHLHRNTTPPRVAIRSVTANGRSYSVYTPVTLLPQTRNLRIGYSVLSLAIPERVQSRYRLLGFDKDWREAGNRVEASLNNLQPGRYTFQVAARNNDGVWNSSMAVINFVIEPAFYQTVWFQFLYVVVGACLLWFIYRLRLRQITARVQLRYAERLAERARVARELHDTLLQSLAGISLQLGTIAKQAVSNPEKLVSLIREIREKVDICFVEARAKVWTLRSTSLEGAGLAGTLEEFCKRVGALTTASCEFCMTGEPRIVAPELEEELLRIAQEAVNNASRHANANRILVTLDYTKKAVVLTVSDDGCGFNTEMNQNQPEQWGLKHIQERAHQIRATYTLTSTLGVGTKIQVRAPFTARWRNSPEMKNASNFSS